jgi:hypothetical protein
VLSEPRAGAEEDVARAGGGRVTALSVVVGVAMTMVVLPAFVAGGAVREAMAGFAGLVAVLGGVKLVAMVWGLAAAVD